MESKPNWVNIFFYIFLLALVFMNLIGTASANPIMPTPFDYAPVFIFINFPFNGFFYTLFLYILLVKFNDKIINDFKYVFNFCIQAIIVLIFVTILGIFIDYFPAMSPEFGVVFFSLLMIFILFLFLTHSVQRLKIRFAAIISFGMCIVNFVSWELTILSYTWGDYHYYNPFNDFAFAFTMLMSFLALFIVLIFLIDIKFQKIELELKINRRNKSLLDTSI